MALGIINAALGFKFALSQNFNYFFIPLVLVVFILLAMSIGTKRFFSARRKKNGEGSLPFGGPAPAYSAPPYESNGGGSSYATAAPVYGGGYASDRSDIALSNLGAPPSYSQQPTKPRDMI